jgi:hypothetical protein
MTPRRTPPGMPAVKMTDPNLLSTAISVSGLGTHDFAADILNVREERITRWLSGERRTPVVIRALCIAIVQRPGLVSEILRSRKGNERQIRRETEKT